MIGDIVNIGEVHIKKAEFILPEIVGIFYKGTKLVVVVSGVSGTGKTEVTALLQRWLFERYRIRAKIIHLDDYYRSDFHSRNEVRRETGIIGKEEIDWKKLNRIINNFKSNEKKLYIQRIHRYLDSIEYTICLTKNIDIILVEGLYANYLEGKDFGIYLDGNISDTYEFRKERAKENPDDEFRQYVLEKEYNCVVQSKRYANLIVPFDIGG